MSDARLSTALPGHPKMKKLVHRLHEAGAWGLVRLILWASENRTSGDLVGLTDEDLELAVDWHGDPGVLIATLEAVGFLDGPEKSRVIHDWLKHQPYVAGAEDRSATSRFAALIKHRGLEGAIQKMPDFYEANKYRYQTPADGRQIIANGREAASETSAPSPSPSPSPNKEGADAPPVSAELSLASEVEPEIQDKTTPQKKKKGGAVRERNELLDALAVVGGGSVETVTRPMWGEAAKALSDIKAVCEDVTPGMIRAAAVAYGDEWPKASLSPSALAKHWSKFAPGAKKEGGRRSDAIAEPHWRWRATAVELEIPVADGEPWARLERSWQVQIWKAGQMQIKERLEQP